jgi:hypothetical protein
LIAERAQHEAAHARAWTAAFLRDDRQRLGHLRK